MSRQKNSYLRTVALKSQTSFKTHCLKDSPVVRKYTIDFSWETRCFEVSGPFSFRMEGYIIPRIPEKENQKKSVVEQ